MEELMIGKSRRKEVFVPLCGINQHVLITGMSGAGKTVKCQEIELQLAKKGEPVIVMNYHNTHDDSQIFAGLRGEYQSYRKHIDVYSTGIALNLFAPCCHLNGTYETTDEVANAVMSIFVYTMTFGARQRIVLRKAVEFAAQYHMFFPDSLSAVKAGLKEVSNDCAEMILEKLHVIFSRPIFTGTGETLEEGRINILDLTRFDMDSQRLITELILSAIWRQVVNSSRANEKTLHLILDEAQNLKITDHSILSLLMKEGRKYHIGVIAATQTLAGLDKAKVDVLEQAATKLFFRQSGESALSAAKKIESENQQFWQKKVQILNVGEYVAAGDFLIDGVQWSKPLILT